MLSRLQGRLVAVLPVRPYDFTDDSGRHVQGTSRKAFIAQSMTSPPILVRFPDENAESPAAFDKLRAMAFADPIDLNVEVNTKTTATFDSFPSEVAKAR